MDLYHRARISMQYTEYTRYTGTSKSIVSSQITVCHDAYFAALTSLILGVGAVPDTVTAMRQLY